MKEITTDDIALIGRIARRANELLGYDQGTVRLDIGAVKTGEGLNLQRLYEFDDINFLHDIVGINENLNRETLMLDNCFSPRCG